MYEDANGVPHPPLRTHNYLRYLGVGFGGGEAPFSESPVTELSGQQPPLDAAPIEEVIDDDESTEAVLAAEGL